MDVRETNGELFEDIMAALEDQSGDESFLLINSFESELLYDVLEEHYEEFETANPAPEEWQVETRSV